MDNSLIAMFYTGIFFIIFGLIFIVVSCSKLFSLIRLKEKGLKTEGRVIRLEEGQMQSSSERPIYITVYYPVFQFTTNDGRTVEKRFEMGSSIPQYKVGDIVPVLYDPVHPGGAEINSVTTTWVMTLAGLAISILAVSGGIALMIAAQRGGSLN